MPAQSLWIALLLWLLPRPASAELADVVAAVRPSVVAVGLYSALTSPRFTFRGTGFVVGDGLTLVTNAHVLPDNPADPALVLRIGSGRPDDDNSGDTRAIPTQFVDKLRTEAQVALEATDARAIPRPAVTAILGSIPELATCSSRECVARFALATAATRVVTTRIAVSGELFDIAVELVDEQGRPLRQRATRCVACNLNDAIARTAAAVRSLAGEEHDDTSRSPSARSRPTRR